MSSYLNINSLVGPACDLLKSSLELHAQDAKVEITPNTDVKLLVKSLLEELEAARQEIAELSCENHTDTVKVQSLDELLECIQLMKVQFRYNKTKYTEIETQYKMETIEQQLDKRSLATAEERVGELQARISQLEIEVDAKEAELEVLRRSMEDAVVQEENADSALSNQLLVELEQLERDYQRGKEVRAAQNEIDETMRRNTRLEKKLGEAQKAAKLFEKTGKDHDNLILAPCADCEAKDLEIGTLEEEKEFLAQQIALLEKHYEHGCSNVEAEKNAGPLAEELAAATAEINSEAAEIAAMLESNKLKDEKIESQDGELRALRDAVTRDRESAELLQAEIKQKDRSIEDLQAQLALLHEENIILQNSGDAERYGSLVQMELNLLRDRTLQGQ